MHLTPATTPYDVDLDENAANYAQPTPLAFIGWAVPRSTRYTPGRQS